MEARDKKTLAGLALVLVGGVVLASVAPNETRRVINALKNPPNKPEEKVVTEDVDYTEVVDTVEPIIQNTPLDTEKIPEKIGLIRTVWREVKRYAIQFWKWLY